MHNKPMAEFILKKSYFSSKESTVTSFKLPNDMIEALDNLAEVTDLKKSEIVRQLLDHFLAQEIKKGTIPAPKNNRDKETA